MHDSTLRKKLNKIAEPTNEFHDILFLHNISLSTVTPSDSIHTLSMRSISFLRVNHNPALQSIQSHPLHCGPRSTPPCLHSLRITTLPNRLSTSLLSPPPPFPPLINPENTTRQHHQSHQIS